MTTRQLAAGESLSLPPALAAQATFTAQDAWTSLPAQVYGYPAYRLLAQQDTAPTGALTLTHVRHPVFGNYLCTAPFGSHGGFAALHPPAAQELLAAAAQLAAALGVEYANLRFLAPEWLSAPPAGWVQHPVYSTYLVDLVPDPEKMLASYSSDHRNHVRKSLKKGFSLRFGHLDLLEDAYAALAQSMHELGSPYHAKAYLRQMATRLGDSLQFAVLYAPDGKRAGAGVFITQGNTVTNLHANILRAYRAEYAGEFLYWQVILHYALSDFRLFDLGRSLIGSGNETFKRKWKPRVLPLAYWYALQPGADLPALNQKNPKFQLAIRVWKRLPAFVVRGLGPFLINGLA